VAFACVDTEFVFACVDTGFELACVDTDLSYIFRVAGLEFGTNSDFWHTCLCHLPRHLADVMRSSTSFSHSLPWD